MMLMMCVALQWKQHMDVLTRSKTGFSSYKIVVRIRTAKIGSAKLMKQNKFLFIIVTIDYQLISADRHWTDILSNLS